MEQRIDLNIRLTGEYAKYVTDEEIFEYIKFELQGGSISNDNPLIDEDKDCEISLVSLY